MIGPRGMRNSWLILASKCDLVRRSHPRTAQETVARAIFGPDVDRPHETFLALRGGKAGT
jgi:hypothetical protein